MPIRFFCKSCNQLLGIATRKAGAGIECPKCGFEQFVPSAETAAAVMAMAQLSKPRSAAEESSQVIAYEQSPAATATFGAVALGAADTVAVQSGAGPAPPSLADGGAGTPALLAGQPVPSGMILFPRRTLYIHAVLFVVVGGVALGAGYLIGRGQAHVVARVESEQAAKERLTVADNLLNYRPDPLSVAPDSGAVVIVLPATKFPEKPFSTQELRPQDVPPGETSQTVRAVRELGGDYTRAGPSGEFTFAVPEQGKYWVLIISRHTTRPAEQPIDEVEQAEIEKYFARASALIGRFKYRWTQESIRIGFNPIEHSFGYDGKP